MNEIKQTQSPVSISDKLFFQALYSGKIKLWKDPGHGWLQVPLDLVNACIKEKGLKVSRFSYKDKNNAYLEEDQDLTLFANCFPDVVFRDQLGIYIQREHKDNIFIRNLNRF